MAATPPAPGIVDGKYRVEHLLGRGGTGAVYRARDLRRRQRVALKVISAELLPDAEALGRFLREATVIARLQHPSIVSVLDYGTLADGGAYLVMELVRGEDLRRVLQREGRLDVVRAARTLAAVCGAIEAAHREGVLHADLKPENILLVGGPIEAKVLDFGAIVGTPAYMAPEQLRGETIDGRTDVFSLGVIAYEMLSGQLPFGRGSVAEVVLAQARATPALAGGTVPAAVERAIRTALDRDADRRPASPQAFSHLLSAALAL